MALITKDTSGNKQTMFKISRFGWEFNVGAEVVFSSAVADGMVIVPSGDGKLYTLHQSNGSKVWEMSVGGAGDPGTSPGYC